MPTLDKAASIMTVSVPLLWLSYLMAAKIHAASHLIPHEILLVSCFVLLESLPAEVYLAPSWLRRLWKHAL